MGLQNPYTPVRFRSWPRTIEYMPGWRNGIREGLKILCQQWLAGSSPASGTTSGATRYFLVAHLQFFRAEKYALLHF